MFCFLQVFYTIFSSVLITLGIPNELFKMGSPFFGLIALIPFYIAISKAKSYKESFYLGLLHAFFTHILSSYWLKNFQGFAIFTLGASAVGTALIEGAVCLFLYYPFSKQNSLFSFKKLRNYEIPVKIFWFAGIYVLYEWYKSIGFLGYPWGTLPMTAIRMNFLVQIVDICGTWGITFLFALFSAFIGEAVIFSTKKQIFKSADNIFSLKVSGSFVCIIFGISIVYGAFQYNKNYEPIKQLNAVLVQHNMDTYRSNEELSILEAQKLTEKGIEKFKEEGLKTDLVVWSEGILNKYFPYSIPYYENFPNQEPLISFIKKQHTPFVIGGALTIDREKHKYGNAAGLFNENGKYIGSYLKIHLVPFAESIPFVEYEAVRKFIKKIAGFSYGWTPGEKYTLFDIPISDKNTVDTSSVEVLSTNPRNNVKPKPTVKISTPICFDDAFCSVCRGLFLAGSEVFINITNDSWSKTQSAEYQHYAISKFRSMETRTTLVRCTNSGFTVVVDPRGKIIDSLPLFESSVLNAKIPVYKRTMTFYARFGNWLPYSILILSFFYILFLENYKKKNEILEISVSLVKSTRKNKSRSKKE